MKEKPTKKIPFRSKKRSKLYKQERIPIVIEMLAEIKVCQRCASRPPVDVHELKSRARGGSITDRDNLVAVCRECHSWITTHPKEAHEQGWLKQSWE